MKYLVLFLVLLTSCNSKHTASIEPTSANNAQVHIAPKTIIIHDTIRLRDTIVVELLVEKKYDSLLNVIKKKNDSLFVERFRLERVKFYNRIVQKNRSQTKFLSGWISRAVQ
ncbi:putative peptidoglycan-binding domain-containing protein [Flavobacterium sp. 25HG05S-40]|uniref:putative peptidoglycan-binding domain-containing protein n=1 Tax=Flavobacterium sp. 25HG05S-40 TaxID=3458682 RepID=UPI004043F9EA